MWKAKITSQPQAVFSQQLQIPAPNHQKQKLAHEIEAICATQPVQDKSVIPEYR